MWDEFVTPYNILLQYLIIALRPVISGTVEFTTGKVMADNGREGEDYGGGGQGK